MAALGMAIAFGLTPSAAPAFQAGQFRLVSQSPMGISAYPETGLDPVWVGLQGGGNTMSRQLLDIRSAAPGFPATAPPNTGIENNLWNRVTGGSSADMVANQQVFAQRLLPGKIHLIHPVTTRFITSRFGWRKNPTGAGHQTHVGQDYGIACGSPVYATADGTVVLSAWAGHSGMRVTIEHGSSVRTGYSHNSKLIARVGDFVKQGQVIALSGTTGNSTGCHVHFEVIINGRWVDPRPYLPGANGQPGQSLNAGQRTANLVSESNTQGPTVRLGHDVEIELPSKTESKKSSKKPADPGPDTIPAIKAPPRPIPAPTTNPNPKPKPAPAPTTKPVPKPAPVPKPETSPKPTPVPKPETTPKPTPVPKPETTPKPTPEPKPETTPKPTPKPAPESNAPEPPVVVVPTPEAKPEPAPDPAPKPVPESSKPEPPVVAPVPSTEAEIKPTPKPAPAEQPKPEPPVVAPAPTPTKTEPAPKPTASDGPLVCDPANVPAGTVVTEATIGELPCFDVHGTPIPGVTGVYTPAARETLG